MNYIVLDLEWDSVYHPDFHRFINQILQIGAVKLNSNLETVDSIELTICSDISPRVTSRFANLTGITSEKMRAGIPFVKAVSEYNEWAGTDTVTMSWSTSDLFAILDNRCLLPDDISFHIEKYIDLQQYIQNELVYSGNPVSNQISLCKAAGIFNVSTEGYELHTAQDDSMVCVSLLRKAYNRERFSALIRDTSDSSFYKRLFFKSYYLNDLDDPLVDREQLKFYCEECGSKLKAMSRWKYRNRNFSAKLCCKKCEKEFIGRVSFRKNFDDVEVKHRLIPIEEVAEDEVQDLSASVSE